MQSTARPSCGISMDAKNDTALDDAISVDGEVYTLRKDQPEL